MVQKNANLVDFEKPLQNTSTSFLALVAVHTAEITRRLKLVMKELHRQQRRFGAAAENALRRSQELYLAGKKHLGIEILNAVLHARRHKQLTAPQEDIIKQYLLICVDLREKQFAKDGLYQYRNLCQREAPASLETVANYLLSPAAALTDLHAGEKCAKSRVGRSSGRSWSTSQNSR